MASVEIVQFTTTAFPVTYPNLLSRSDDSPYKERGAVVQDQRSIRVMERLGMKQDTEPFFDHPEVSDDRLR